MTDSDPQSIEIAVQEIPADCPILDVAGLSHIEAVHLLIKQLDQAQKNKISQIAILTGGPKQQETEISTDDARMCENAEQNQDTDPELEPEPTLFHSIGKTLILALKKGQIISCRFLNPAYRSGYLITLKSS